MICQLAFPALAERSDKKTMSTMSLDYWHYVDAQNKKEPETGYRYSIEQYLAARLVEPEELSPACVIGAF